MTRPHLERLRGLVHDILGAPDPRFELPAENRWAAELFDKSHPYSGALRSGLVGSIVQLAINGEHVAGGSGQGLADVIVHDLLDGKQTKRKDAWPALAHWLPDLAEAAPVAFLESVEALIADKEAVAAIFQEEGIFGFHPHVFLLWALERLAWSEDFLTRVTAILGDLAAVDPGGRMSSRPQATLVEIFLPWHPQTTASVDHRLTAIDLLLNRQPNVAWKLCVSLLPGREVMASDTAQPRWRNWKTVENPKVSPDEYKRFSDEILTRVLALAGTNGDRWAILIQAYDRFRLEYPSAAKLIIESLRALAPSDLGEESRVEITSALRQCLSRHRELKHDAKWAMSEHELNVVDALYDHFQPHDLVERYAWLFHPWPELPTGGRFSGNYEENERRVEEERTKALKRIYGQSGIDGVLALASRSQNSDIVGTTLALLT